jgi:hypothetical protein
VNPGESYDPLLVSITDEKEGYLMGKTKDLSAFEWGVVVGASRTGFCQITFYWSHTHI